MAQSRFFRILFLFSVLCLPMVSSAQVATYCGDPAFENKVSSVLSFSVPLVSVAELQEMGDVILLDARELEEYKVSHLPGATYIGYDKPEWEVIDDLPKDSKIVIYCSIGYRSEKLGEKIQEKGYSNVYNLYGSIFEWANAGLPLIDHAGSETHSVHTYNRRWSQWVTNPEIEKTW